MPETTRCVRCGDPLPADYDRRRPCPRCLLELALGDPAGEIVHTGGGEPSPPPPAPAELASDFPQLEIQELLGEGGMGVVYRARQRELDREVALKILRPRGADAGAFAERFLREARALARLSHPGIVAVYDFGRTGERFFLLMELVDGTNLRRLIRDGALSPRQALDVVSQVCAALQFAHDRGIVHRDIKPENILVDRAGRVKIADFGLAKMVHGTGAAYVSRLTQASQRMGTPQYMAPEQIEHPLDVDHRADIYSLGVVFYELLTGELPIGRFAPPSRKVEVDVRLDDVVLKSLEKDPGRRYQHASEVKTSVDDIQRSPGTGKKLVTKLEVRGGRPARSAGFWILAVLAVLLAISCVPLACAAWLLSPLTTRSASPPPAAFEYRIFEDAPGEPAADPAFTPPPALDPDHETTVHGDGTPD
ncbi:MAG: serine/threonine-protein kinase [Planctomycetota bacterium]